VQSLAPYGAVLLGAPLFMFRWHKEALRFLSQHRKDLTVRPVAVFALGPTHEPHDEQEWQDSRTQLGKELARYLWFKPVALQMFGGRYDPTKLRFPVNVLAGDVPASDLRDWEAIRAWATGLTPLLAPGQSK
jgi:menaquinone-dependent protoporphyrinogen oxidase